MATWPHFQSRSTTIDSLYSPSDDVSPSTSAAPQNTVQSPSEDDDDEDTKFDYLHFAKFLAFRSIQIIPLSQLTHSTTGENIEESVKKNGQKALLDIFGGRSFSIVRAKWNGTIDVALKVAKSRETSKLLMEDVFYDAQVMSHSPLCDHPNIVKLLGFSFYDFQHPLEGHQVYPILVVEAAHPEYPDLEQFVNAMRRERKRIDLDLVYEFIADIADGLTALHSFGVVHGDIKPSNLLVFQRTDRLVIKISDFASTQFESTGGQRVRAVTDEWHAKDPFVGGEDKKTLDVYSFGLVCLYLTSNGLRPFEFHNPTEFDGNWTDAIENNYQDVEDSTSRLAPLFTILEEALKRKRDERRQSLLGISSTLVGRYTQI